MPDFIHIRGEAPEFERFSGEYLNVDYILSFTIVDSSTVEVFLAQPIDGKSNLTLRGDAAAALVAYLEVHEVAKK